jgi:hypothetical protein
MTTVTTSTASYATKGGRHTAVTAAGVDWAMSYNLASTRFEFRYSNDNGATWTENTSLRVTVAANRAAEAEFYIGAGDRACFASCGSGGYQVRFTPNLATATSWTTLTNNTSQNTVQIGCRVFNYGTLSGTPTYAILVFESNSGGELDWWTWQRRVSNNSAYSEQRVAFASGLAESTQFDFDFQHNGDGKTAVTNPAIYVVHRSLIGNRVWFQRRAWNNTQRGWSTTVSGRLIYSGSATSTDPLAGLFDGTRFVMAFTDTGSPTLPRWFERNAADTTTTPRTVPALSDGTIKGLSLGRDGTGDTRLYAIGSGGNVYRSKFQRAAGTFESWATIANPGLATSNSLSVQAGYRGNGANLLYTAGLSSPFGIQFRRDAFNVAPTAPTWVSPANNAAVPVASAPTLVWTFNDPDAGDTQSAYALSRQINGGTLEYLNAAAGTWGASEVKNTSTSSSVNLAGPGDGIVDAGDVGVFKVKTWDAADVAGPYGSSLTLTGSVPVTPVLTAPADASTITTSTIGLVEWTTTEQTAYRVRLLTSADAVIYDSGKIVSDSTSHEPATALTNGLTGAKVEVRVWNADGLEGPTDTHTFDVAFVAPATPTLVVAADNANGRISVTVTDPTPSGDPLQPTVTSRDLFVRVAAGGRTVGERSTDAAGIRIAAGSTDMVLYDYAAASGVDFEYMVRARASSNGTSSDSAWT